MSESPLVLSPPATQLRNVSIDQQQQQHHQYADVDIAQLNASLSMPQLSNISSTASTQSTAASSQQQQQPHISTAATACASAAGLESILFASFDTTAGPLINCQVPSAALSTEAFLACSDYVIASRSISHKLITLQRPREFILLSLPLQIMSNRYHRNSLMYNVSFVFGGATRRQDTCAYRVVLRKLGAFLETLELETDFLTKTLSLNASSSNNNTNANSQQQQQTSHSQQDRHSPKMNHNASATASVLHASNTTPSHHTTIDTALEPLRSLLHKVFLQLIRVAECTVRVNKSNTIKLQLYPLLPLPPAPHSIAAHCVPVLIRDLSWLVSHCSDEDLIVRELLPHCNGQLHCGAIARRSGHTLATVQQCIAQLIYFGTMCLVSVFQFMNEYRIVHSRLVVFMQDEEMRQQAIQFAFPHCFVMETSDENSQQQQQQIHPHREMIERHQLTRDDALQFIARVLSYMHSGVTVGQIVSAIARQDQDTKDASTTHRDRKHDSTSALHQRHVRTTAHRDALLLRLIDLRRLCLFAQLNRIIQRVHLYPMRRERDGAQQQKQPSTASKAVDSTPDSAPISTGRLLALCDGSRCCDAICLELGISTKQLLQLLSQHSDSIDIIKQ